MSTVLVPRPAATVMVVRDGPGSLEVLMLRRSLESEFVRGAYVFPGGALDPGDGHPEMLAHCAGRDDEGASTALGLDEGGLAYWVAAFRECFEEAGVLVAAGPDGRPVSFADPEAAARFSEHRAALNDGSRSFLDICRVEGLTLPADRLDYVGHWITPVGPPRRYDTRFFVTPHPAGQTASHDEIETIDHMWVTPEHTLARQEAGQIELLFPTIWNLRLLGGFATVQALLGSLSSLGDIPTMRATISLDEDGRPHISVPLEPGDLGDLMTKAAAARHGPTPLPDFGVGPPVVVGAPVSLTPLVVRLTAPNPGRMTGPGTNTYLVGGREIAVLDPGPVIEEHLAAIVGAASARGATVRWIVVTHHHPDHAPAAPVLAARTGAEFLAFGHEEGVDPDRRVGEGFVLGGPGFALRALHTPGHASDHLCWLLEGERLLFSGDHVMHGSTVVIRPPDADMTAYLDTLARLAGLEPPIDRIAPGHGRLIGDPAGLIAAIVGHRLDREAKVAAALSAAGRGTLDDLLPSVYEDVAESMLDVARFSLWAHLQKLALEGRAALLDDGEHDPRRSTESSLWGSVPSVREPARR